MKKISLLFIIMIFLTACTDSVEIEKISIASLMGLDISDNDEIILTVEIIDMQTNIPKGKVITVREDSIAKAIDATSSIAGKPSYFSHTNIVLISEKLAIKRMEEILQYLTANEEIRLSSKIIITNGISPDKFIRNNISNENIFGVKLFDMLKSAQENSSTSITELYKNVTQISDGTILFFTSIDENMQFSIAGMDKSNLFFMNENQVKSYLILKNKLNKSTINTKSGTFNINKAKTISKVTEKSGNIYLDIDVSLKLSALESINDGDFTKLETEINTAIKNLLNINELYKLGDVLSIKQRLIRYKNETKMLDDFSNLKTNIKVNSKITDTGYLSKSIKRSVIYDK